MMKVSSSERVRAKSWAGVLATIGMLLQATQRLMTAAVNFLNLLCCLTLAKIAII
ncbi:hypothetical protein KKD40_03635 [Candidatus Micrarchaeota archaeon]|nr:hypothetical protein [Candidatus Micrarchaeota archaeon]